MSAIVAGYIAILTTGICHLVVSVEGQSTGDVRLVGPSAWTGLLEVWYQGRYAGVCDDFFNSNTAKVVCRQLGFPSTSPTYKSVSSSSSVYLDNVKCSGNEAKISDCNLSVWRHSDCAASEHPYLTCSANPCHNDSCSNGGRCVQVLDANYRCECPPGYQGPKCENDVNECLSNNGDCSHLCVNTPGSYHCDCTNVELRLGSDNRTCYAEGLHVTCTSDNMEVTFDQQYFRGMHGQYLTLRDKTCTAVDTHSQVKISVPLEGCGTSVKQVGDRFVYENQVLSHTVPVQGLVTRVRDVNITVRCVYRSNNTVGNYYRVDTGELHFTDHNLGTYQISMDLIHKGSTYHPTDSLPLSLEPREEVSVRLSLQTNDSDLQVFARNCKATPTSTIQSPNQYLVLDNGCSTDPSFTTKNINGFQEEILSLETFKFLDNSSTVYLHCEVLVCNVTDPASRCRQGCLSPGLGRRRTVGEEVSRDDNYLSSHSLSVGPITVDRSDIPTRTKKSDTTEMEHHKSSDPESSRATLAAGLALLGVVLIMITVALSIIFKNDDEDNNSDSSEDTEKLLNSDE